MLSGATFVMSLDIVDAWMTSPRFPLQKAPKSRTHSLTFGPIAEFAPGHVVPFFCCNKLAEALEPKLMEAVRRITFLTANIGQL